MSEPEEHPPSPFDSLRDPRAVLDTTLAPVAFVIVYAITKSINASAIVAVGIGVVIMIERLLRGRPVINAVAGLFGTALAAFIAVRSGKAADLLLPEDGLPAGPRPRLRRLRGDPQAGDRLHHRHDLPRARGLGRPARRCAG